MGRRDDPRDAGSRRFVRRVDGYHATVRHFFHRLTYPLLAGIFLAGGLDAARSPADKVDRADHVVPQLLRAVGVEAKTEDVVRINGIVQVVAAALLAASFLPRLAASVLLGSLGPTTVAGHRFWEESDDAARAAQRVQFLKNLAMLGGLVLVATSRRD